MLSYLTHKLRTPELNGSSAFHTKTDDDHDSGTESDDESAEIEELQKYMEHSIQLEDGSGHSPGRRRVLYQQTRFANRQQPPPPPPPHHHHHHHNHHHHHHQQSHQPQRRRHPQQISINGGGPAVEAPPTRKPVPSPPVPSAVVTLLSPGGLVATEARVAVSPSPVALDSALPSDSDHTLDQHSSEEELEVINNRAGSAEKRKWSQANQRRVRDARASLRRSRSDGAGGDTSSEDEDDLVTTGVDDVRAGGGGVTGDDDDDEEDDDDVEVRDLTWSRGGAAVVLNGACAAATTNGSFANGVHRGRAGAVTAPMTPGGGHTTSSSHRCIVVPPTPVEFRASPPLHVHRPYNGSPPPKVFHAAAASGGLTSSLGSSVSSGGTSAHIPAFEVCAVSPRKRHRQDRGGGTAFGVFSLVDGGPVQRPCLDFEKMQQIRVKLL
ncbi:uncharacterized protein LOC120848907 isoform X1 [Ixodes scapularis]|uniref:uncharacterized protein LOC120848907 isoform X1 n=1 Tax=Ixodes scapularis TaxID=6945 RepID=UPI001C38F93D|nr:uncharacterized protein LOC120848907 isoform X1 [Ixodes scapularis]